MKGYKTDKAGLKAWKIFPMDYEEKCAFSLVRNVLVYTAESQTGHTEITESISDKQKQISKPQPAVGPGAVSQSLLEANGTAESISGIPALHPNTTDREHINNNKKCMVQLKADAPKPCLQPMHLFLYVLQKFELSFVISFTKNIMT